jgi:hypothetical protein
MSDFDLNNLGRDELTDLFTKVMLRLRRLEAEEIKHDFILKSKKLHMDPFSQGETNLGGQCDKANSIE